MQKKSLIVAVVISFGIGPAAWAKGRGSTIRDKNFGQVNEHLYRGAQPDGQDYSELASMGIRSIINLRQEPDDDQRDSAEAAGLKYYHISLSDSSHPPHDKIDEFLSIVQNVENQPVFVHCKGGRHRTGALIGIYRILNDSWSADAAYREMKEYQFEKGFGHGNLKDCVYEYYDQSSRKGLETSERHR